MEPATGRGSLFGGPHGGPATVIGSLTDQPLAAIMTVRDQTPHGAGYVTAARLTASVGENALALSGTFNLDGNYDFDHGTIAGSDRGAKVDLTVAGHSAAGNSPATAPAIRGSFAGSSLDIAAVVPNGPGQRGSVVGTVGTRRVDLQIEPTGRSGGLLHMPARRHLRRAGRHPAGGDHRGGRLLLRVAPPAAGPRADGDPIPPVAT